MSSHPVSIRAVQPSPTRHGKSGCKLHDESTQGAHRADRHTKRGTSCDHHQPVDDHWALAHGEAPAQRLNRTYAEILQEVRVAQTGVQVMLAFVLTLAFTPRFSMLTEGELHLYIATLVLAAVAASLLMTPAAFNRLVYRSGLRRRMIITANRFAFFGLVCLLGAMGCAIMLILQVVIGSGIAVAITTTVISWCVLIWFAVPAWWRYQHRECGSDWLGKAVQHHTAEHRTAAHHTAAHRTAEAHHTAERPTVIVGDVQRPRRRATPVMEMAWNNEHRDDLVRARWKVHYVVQGLRRQDGFPHQDEFQRVSSVQHGSAN